MILADFLKSFILVEYALTVIYLLLLVCKGEFSTKAKLLISVFKTITYGFLDLFLYLYSDRVLIVLIIPFLFYMIRTGIHIKQLEKY